MDLDKFERLIIRTMLALGENVRSNFGKVSFTDKAGEGSDYDIVSKVDKSNQEEILKAVYKIYPDIEISVEEELNSPTEVQRKFYQNDGKSNLILGIDGIDGTYTYGNGSRDDYGIIVSLMKLRQDKPRLGEFIFAIIYYPSLRFFIIADGESVFRMNESGDKIKLERFPSRKQDRLYSVANIMKDEEKTILGNFQVISEIYSYTQLIFGLVRGEINGFLMPMGHVYDGSVVVWIAKRLGFDVAYLNGKPFGLLSFGDNLVNGKRVWPYDRNGMLIIGNRKDKVFSKYNK